jgi:hypothetical protein
MGVDRHLYALKHTALSLGSLGTGFGSTVASVAWMRFQGFNTFAY